MRARHARPLFVVPAVLGFILGAASRAGGFETLVAYHRPSAVGTGARLLPRTLVGEAIEDGVGYRGIRIGMSASEVVTKWGATSDEGIIRKSFIYRREGGEQLRVLVKDGMVEGMIFLTAPDLSQSSLRTARAIQLGSRFDQVRAKYGDPDAQRGPIALYIPKGIGFDRYQPPGRPDILVGIWVFKPRAPFESDVVP